MQYILNEQEYHELQTAVERGKFDQKRLIQKLCTEVAVHKPVIFWGRDTAEPWGCIHSDDKNMGYCDDCPVQAECPTEFKKWSK